jgi:hypothetical protein
MAWEKVAEYTNPAWYSFSGEYTKAVVTFKTGPEQLTWVLTNPIGEWLGDRIQNEAQARGQTILFYSLQKNTDPTWTTDWQIDLWGYGSPLLVALIVLGALAAVGIAYYSYKIVSQVQETKRAEIQKETEAARIAFIEKYEPIYGDAVIDWLNGITKPPPEVATPTLLDDLKKALPGIGIGAGTVIIIALALFFFIGRR